MQVDEQSGELAVPGRPSVPGSRFGHNCHWENWTRNGEVCIVGLDPPSGGVRLASCMTWLLRSFASHCRCIHDATGELVFMCTGAGMPSALVTTIAHSFNLALSDPKLIQARVARRGGTAGRPWPTLWLETAVHEYVLGREPFPAVGSPRRKILLLANEQQVWVQAGGVAKVPAGAARAWRTGLDAFGELDESAASMVLGKDEHAFALNVMVLVHTWPEAPVRPRPGLDESYERHQRTVSELATVGEEKGLPVAWHALWRLPPAMTWTPPGAQAWARYPAVSLVAAARPLPWGKQ
jgi:hypothetical protein